MLKVLLLIAFLSGELLQQTADCTSKQADKTAKVTVTHNSSSKNFSRLAHLYYS